MDGEKIGEVNFGKFKTEFRVTKKVKDYIKNEAISLACLLPNARDFYDNLLFDHMGKNEDGKPNKEFGKKFLVIYNKIPESGGWSEKKGLETTGFEEKIKNKEEIIFYSGTVLVSVKDNKKEFVANYVVIKSN